MYEMNTFIQLSVYVQWHYVHYNHLRELLLLGHRICLIMTIMLAYLINESVLLNLSFPSELF